MKSIFFSLILIVFPMTMNAQIIYDEAFLPLNNSLDKTSKMNHFLLNIVGYGRIDENIPLRIFGNTKIKRFSMFEGKVSNGVVSYNNMPLNYEFEYDNKGRYLSLKSFGVPKGIDGYVDFKINYEQINKITFQLIVESETSRGYIILENEKIVEFYDEFLENDGTYDPSKNWFYSDYDVCGNYTKRKIKAPDGNIYDEDVNLVYHAIDNCDISKWQEISWKYDTQGRLIGRNNVDFQLDAQKRIYKVPRSSSNTTRYDYDLNGKVSSIVDIRPTRRDSVVFEYVEILNATNGGFDKHKVHIFPNPATQMFHIEVDHQVSGQVSYQLFNAFGQLVYRGNIESEISTVDVSPLSKGMYYLQILDGDKIINKKLIIE